MRVTQAHAHRVALRTTMKRQAEAFEAAEVASSGLKLLRPSDDPVGARTAMLARRAEDGFRQGVDSAEHLLAEQRTQEDALSGMSSALGRARELAMSMANGTMTADARATAAVEVDQIRSRVAALANAALGGKYLFGGARTDQPPFDSTGTYQGDTMELAVDLPLGTSMQSTLDGGELLAGRGGAPDVLGSLADLSAALESDDLPQIRAGLDALDASMDHLAQARSELGARMAAVEGLRDAYEMSALGAAETRAGVEEADLIEAFSEVVRTRQGVEQALQVTVQSRTPSIFELL